MTSSSLTGSRTWPGGSKIALWSLHRGAGRPNPGRRSPRASAGQVPPSWRRHGRARPGCSRRWCLPGLLRAIQLVDDNDRHEQVHVIFPDLQQRPEIQVFQFVLMLDVDAGISHSEDARPGPAPYLRIQRLDRCLESVGPLDQLKAYQVVEDSLGADIGARHRARRGQQPIMGPGQDQAIKVRSRDLAAEMMDRIRKPLQVTGNAALCRPRTAATAEVTDACADLAERLQQGIPAGIRKRANEPATRLPGSQS